MARRDQTATAPAEPEKETKGSAKGGVERPPRSTADLAVDWLKSIGAALVLFVILRTFVVQTFVITSSSMEETLLVGDFLILNKVAYGALIPFSEARLPGYAELERGHIVVFRPPHDPDLDVVKRIVGMPGDTLRMETKALFINGARPAEPYVRHSDTDGDVAHRWMRWQCGERVALSADISGAYRVPPGGAEDGECSPSRDTWGPIVVPDGQLFMMGDNRDDSVDSRYWGFLDADRVRGKASVIYYSYDAERLRPFAFIRNIRPGRIGDRIR